MTETSEAVAKTAEEELAGNIASVIQDFCEDLPRRDCERVGAQAARAAWGCGSAPRCGAWGGCTQPAGHNRGRADVQENHGPFEDLSEAQRSATFWQGQAENWEREHQSTVLPYTAELEAQVAALRNEVDESDRLYVQACGYNLRTTGQLEKIRAALVDFEADKFAWWTALDRIRAILASEVSHG